MKNKKPYIGDELTKKRVIFIFISAPILFVLLQIFNPPDWLNISYMMLVGIVIQINIKEKFFTSDWIKRPDECASEPTSTNDDKDKQDGER